MVPKLILVALRISPFLYPILCCYKLHIANDYLDNYQTISGLYLLHHIIRVFFKKNTMVYGGKGLREIKKYAYDKLSLIQSFRNLIN